jgi:probable addiction module antidote protein
MKTIKIKTTDFFEDFASKFKNPKKLIEFEKAVNKAYALTGDPSIIFAALKVITLTKGNTSALARKSNLDRKSIYNMFKNGSNPTFKNVAAVSHNLGVNLNLSFAHK